MTQRHLTIIIGSILILAQVALFRNYLPFLPNKIVITNQWCTCPNARVLSGRNYLKTITPDSLKKYDLDYSEMFIENDISTSSDPMGVKHYLVTGEIIGKGSISEGDENYYPLFKIDSYYEAFLFDIVKWSIMGLLLIESFILYRLVKRKMNDA
jgi:hypothetical protein